METYFRAASTSFAHAISASLRRRRTHVAFALVILPALIPLSLALLPHEHGDEEVTRGWVLTQMIEIFYVTGVTPLLALFFAAMLVGEEVESQTVSYILTRPIPRSAWVVGKFAAYVAVCSGLVGASIITLCLSVILLEDPQETHVGILTLLRYEGVAAMSLLGYGSVCALLGARFRHPVIIGALLIFGWERIAMLAPGVTDFLTIQKYTTALLPDGGRSVANVASGRTSELYRATIAVQLGTAALVLVLLALFCLALASWVVREREYTMPAAVTD